MDVKVVDVFKFELGKLRSTSSVIVNIIKIRIKNSNKRFINLFAFLLEHAMLSITPPRINNSLEFESFSLIQTFFLLAPDQIVVDVKD